MTADPVRTSVLLGTWLLAGLLAWGVLAYGPGVLAGWLP